MSEALLPDPTDFTNEETLQNSAKEYFLSYLHPRGTKLKFLLDRSQKWTYNLFETLIKVRVEILSLSCSNHGVSHTFSHQMALFRVQSSHQYKCMKTNTVWKHDMRTQIIFIPSYCLVYTTRVIYTESVQRSFSGLVITIRLFLVQDIPLC